MIKFKKGHEARVIILGTQRKLVIKIYNSSASNIWLARVLELSYGKSFFRNSICEHEFRILGLLFESGFTPRPYIHFFNVLIMSDVGRSFEETTVNIDGEISNQAKEIYKLLQSNGLKHNDVKKSNLTIKNGRLFLIDFTLCDSPWIRITDHNPNPDWGRFGSDQVLLNLENLGA